MKAIFGNAVPYGRRASNRARWAAGEGRAAHGRLGATG